MLEVTIVPIPVRPAPMPARAQPRERVGQVFSGAAAWVTTSDRTGLRVLMWVDISIFSFRRSLVTIRRCRARCPGAQGQEGNVSVGSELGRGPVSRRDDGGD